MRDLRPALHRVSWTWAALLFAATFLATTVVGARLAYNFHLGRPSYVSNTDLFPFAWVWHHPATWLGGLSFSLPLLAILLAHELGHYLACRHYGLDSTLPIFLPAPTLIGTIGAFIRIKSAFFERCELFDVGIAGPLAGMILTLPLLTFGLATSHVLTPAQLPFWRHQYFEFGWPPLAQWIEHGLRPGTSIAQLSISPVARAAWVGLLLTMLNLVPGAQLDGGHILYAASPTLHRIASWGAMLLMIFAGWRFWPGWFVFAGFIALMRVRHPPVPKVQPLGKARAALALLALAVFALTFMLTPLAA